MTTVCSIAGGSCGYAVGLFLQPVGDVAPVADRRQLCRPSTPGTASRALILIAVPIPYKITAIASGMARLNFGLFICVSVLVRGLRFGAEALLLKIYGEPIRAFVEKRLGLVASAAALADRGAWSCC